MKDRADPHRVGIHQLFSDEGANTLFCVDNQNSGFLVTLKVRRGSLNLILTNLLDNAIKFSRPGGRITVHIELVGTDAVLRVADLGPGIPAQELQHIFRRFYRGSEARADAPSGVGLGLALSHAIVRSHGGRIEASNLPEGGALFTVRLPLHA
jgi:two-component system OmpR family sensor kinase